MKIFLSGGYGMVGANIKEHKNAKKHEILAPKHKELDLLDFSAVRGFLKDTKPDLIIHSAALVGGIAANMARAYDFLLQNTRIGINIIEASKEAGVERFLNLASSCIYPRNYNGKIPESALLSGELEPTNEGYALAKIIALKLCEYTSNFGLNYKTLIPCNLYGKYDKFDARAHLLPAVIAKIHEAKQNGFDVEIWGDGSARREFLYAGDFAEFVWEAVERYSDLPNVINVGLGYDYSILEYYKAAASVIGFEGSFKFDLNKPTGMKQKLCDISLLEKFGWRAKTSLENGIKQVYEYYLDSIESK